MKRVLLFVLFAAAGACASSPAPKPAAGVVETTTSTTVAAAFDVQAYCVARLKTLAVTYPKTLGALDYQNECRRMIGDTGATSARTVDALLATAETYYKAMG